MKAKIAWRIASGLTLFFGLAHTAGMFSPSHGSPEEDALVASMKSFHFVVMGSSRSYWDYLFGFGLLLTASLLFLGVLSWQLGNLSETEPALARRLGWPLLLLQLAIALLCLRYFFLAPTLTSAGAAIATALALRARERPTS
ncbi:MAG TPA: hypothetical protein PK413_00820 [Thermoanaerobaculia bacterium]|nr:hypothetical protein [Thermoanaerobaculia bacterium]